MPDEPATPLDIDAINARVDRDHDDFQVVRIDDYDALVGEVVRLRAALRRFVAAWEAKEAWPFSLELREAAREARRALEGG